ncbi:MAG TPA: sigma-70 family RNA polymerase sigma factor [Burkholderiales bacterium]|nr:sigma-70 family RNA polymerase sigma factor [Burkholderiales bacterium]
MGVTAEERLKDLLVHGLAGDEAAYRGFLAGLAAHLRAFVRRRLARMPDDVEDIVQESLLAVHNQRHTYDAAQPLTAWVHAIARYKLVDHLRRVGDAPLGGDAIDEAAELLQGADHHAAEARRDIGKLLERLPERQRRPIVHVKLEGLSVAETARLTGMSPSAVKVNVHRGLKALAASLKETR